MRKKEQFRGKNVLIAGGGDSALDWTVNLQGVVSGMSLVHRRNEFRGMQATVDQMYALVKEGKVNLQIGDIIRINGENGQISSVTLRNAEKQEFDVAWHIVALLWPNHETWADCGLGYPIGRQRPIPVSTESFETAVPGIFCIGDMRAYPGKRVDPVRIPRIGLDGPWLSRLRKAQSKAEI